MPELNISLPPIEVFVPWTYIRKEQSSKAHMRGFLVSVASIPGQALLFSVLFDDGALYERIPVSQLFHNLVDNPSTLSGNEIWSTRDLQYWDCPSVNVVYTVYDALVGLQVNARMPERHELMDRTIRGTYEGTFDWYGDAVSEGVGDLGHKAAHFLRLENGQFALYPNDKIAFHSPAFTTPFSWANPPRYKRNSKIYRVEG